MWNRMILTMRMLCVVVMVMLIALLSVSCTSDPEIIEVTRIVENVVEVVKEFLDSVGYRHYLKQ